MDKIVKRRKTKKKEEAKKKVREKKPTKVEKPDEFNYQARKQIMAINKRIEEGREYFIKDKHGARQYIKNEKSK